MATAPHRPDHGALMDQVYRGQRHIYDLTRKYYLFGRDRLIRELDGRPGMAALELGCGTGRNLRLISSSWPGMHCFGLDISSEMLKNARKRLGTTGTLALGDATSFDAPALFGRAGFDRVVLSYALSMIPDWQAALTRAGAALAPGGSLHVVDFGDCDGLPAPLRRLLDAWLARFHVSPRRDLPEVAERLARAQGLRMHVLRGPLGYYQLVRLTR
ncbi:S-adenosylmethionine-diacylgycerolhomoserine-N-methlytransferase [Novosphingobium sp. CF614]|uniref:class I SAM-dependent methyltransferase n=1 Tax=Novosphingobium sp. CF614 TaxID=1884364 RepID=UPI0008E49F16|nr:class I SAM-dependent methyltransferase [Novosphingobium sp. CF614]SFG04292.1 S-adenosylmethionine-diacylgycerolhomoserine-N-methlytransferase [Novosphingobium sp. CF614]